MVLKRHDYTLDFGPDAKRIEFRAKTVVEALTLAETLLKEGEQVTLLEDGIPLGSLFYSPAAYPAVTLGRVGTPVLC